MKIVDKTLMSQLDNTAITDYGISEDILMENASLATYEVIKERFSIEDEKILIIAGSGNNGGDGLALARKLYSRSCSVEVFLVAGCDNYKEAARKNYEAIRKLGIKIIQKDEIDGYKEFFDRYSLLIDGIFGIGLDRTIDGDYSKLIDAINHSSATTLSLDIPSGINSDTGEIMGVAVEADITVAYGLVKNGNILSDGQIYCGDLYLSKISFPPKLYDHIETTIIEPLKLPSRKANCHKGSFGKVLFVGGGAQYFGAPYFNSVAFLKSGGAYSRLACPNSVVKVLASKANEVVYYPMKETSKGNLSIENLKQILDFSKEMDLVVLGGGFSREEESSRLAQILISKLECPILVDADALTALGEKLEVLYHRKHPTILTPHLGEMGSLCGLKVEEIEKNPMKVAKEFAKKYRTTLLLKGARTIIAYPDGHTQVNISGNSTLAIAGSGDILAGVIAGQFSLGFGLDQAVSMGTFMHGYCADLLREKLGEDGIMAEDILNHLPQTLKHYRLNYEKVLKEYRITEV